MAKIKRKVEMNLPQLIEWAWENNIKNQGFISNRDELVYFDEFGDFIVKDSFFEVEIEESITLETQLFGVVAMGKDIYGKWHSTEGVFEENSIKEILSVTTDELIQDTTIHYYAKVKKEFVCVYKNGVMVE
ncbi:hypothetical protein H6K86_06830 [Staphylococcus epidermidis]|uniref:hypothetical protein n=1 Tax=Staphylococcus epidermidis TaxID=1282 RepID=UPI00124410DA|nr:hypothetical protein [Staphylococcus epidermidis]KAA9389612.1 hypothetical protein F6I16_07855 [Staphylococcus epidermidis]MBM6201843.1 hypothetical protein [Staphylococcus epidermidis]MBM6209095.1 hypothetical protein [Staphylococcus epidermidis]MBM6211315.1 hypothetical protein [Staphylococcus epidermidis]MBM6218257.1 hypothetical protein [Staphylococcus epidermidis]